MKSEESGNCGFSLQNEEKNQFIPHMLAYVGIFVYLCALICVIYDRVFGLRY